MSTEKLLRQHFELVVCITYTQGSLSVFRFNMSYHMLWKKTSNYFLISFAALFNTKEDKVVIIAEYKINFVILLLLSNLNFVK